MKLAIAFISIFMTLSLFASDFENLTGQEIFARQCAQCHGVAGVSVLKNVPNLSGQKSLYVTEQLKAFRDGKRPGTVMPAMAKTLNDAMITELAQHLESLNGCVN